VTYAHKIDKAESTVDWSQGAASIARRIRAFDPFPGVSTTSGADTFKLWGAFVDGNFNSELLNTEKRHGHILFINEAGIGVQTGQGVLALTHLQRAGGKRLPAADFLRGCPLTPGMVLGTPGA
jgi:methionyl-tRNA formyltransferase